MDKVGLVLTVLAALFLQRQITKNLDRVRHSTEQLSFAGKTVEAGRKQRRDARKARRRSIACLFFWALITSIAIGGFFLSMLRN